MSRDTNTPRNAACPPPPQGCAATAGEPCLSHGGTRVRHNFHRARTAAWETQRLAGDPAAKLVADAVTARTIRHGSHAAELLDGHGYAEQAERIRTAVSERNGLMSAKQAVALLLDAGQGGDD
ncbi:hypothetical protein [Streptomyces sp. NPDC058202]|uniref:hypothetical protein n=1 Tax=Streptomyces sp. NPDC058202 TaxID=3346380 RepID=UPI0036EF878D